MRPMFAMPRSAMRASRSPLRAMASSRVLRDRTSENSTATKKPFSSKRTTIETMRPSTATNLHRPGKTCRTLSHMHHHHHDGHEHHHHHHDESNDRSTRALRLALALTLSVLVAEIIGGWL